MLVRNFQIHIHPGNVSSYDEEYRKIVSVTRPKNEEVKIGEN